MEASLVARGKENLEDSGLRKPWRNKLESVLRKTEMELRSGRSSPTSSLSPSTRISMIKDGLTGGRDTEHTRAIEKKLESIAHEARKEAHIASRGLTLAQKDIEEMFERVQHTESYFEQLKAEIGRKDVQILGMERWQKHFEGELCKLQGICQEQLEMYRNLQAHNTPGITREKLFTAIGEAVESVREEMLQHVRSQALTIAKVQNLSAMATALVDQWQGQANISDSMTRADHVEIKSYVQDTVRAYQQRIEERIQSLDRDLNWKVLQETRSLERKVHECQTQLFYVMSTQQTAPGNRPLFSTSGPPPPPPPMATSLPIPVNTNGAGPPTSGGIWVEKGGSKSLSPSPDTPGAITKFSKMLKDQEEELARLEQLIESKDRHIEAMVQSTMEKQFAKYVESHQAIDTEIKKDIVAAVEMCKAAETRCLELENNLWPRIEKLENEVKAFVCQKAGSRLDALESHQVCNEQKILKVSENCSDLEKSMKSIEKGAHDRIEMQELDCNRLKVKLAETVATMEKSQIDSITTSESVKGNMTTLQSKIEALQTKLERNLSSLVERVARVERANASAQVERRAQQELEEARARAIQKAGTKTNSAGSAPPSVTVTTSVSAEDVVDTPAGQQTKRYSIPPTSGVPSAVNRVGGREKSPEQLEREAKRQEELAAVRARLAAFEAKWKQNQQKTVAIRQQPPPPPPKTPPPQHLINQNQNGGYASRPSTAPSTQLVNEPRSVSGDTSDSESTQDDEDIQDFDVPGDGGDEIVNEYPDGEEEEENKAQTSDGDGHSPSQRKGHNKDQDDEESEEIESDEESDDDEVSVGVWDAPIAMQVPPPNTMRQSVGTKKPLSGTIECKFCRRVLPGKNTAALHEKVCDKRPRVQPKTVTCEFCDESFSETQIETHKTECDWLPSKCQYCNMIIILRDIDRHETRCSKNPQKSRVESALSQLAGPKSASKDVKDGGHFEEWSNKDVLTWLNSIDGIDPMSMKGFVDMEVDGTMLMEMKEVDVRNLLKVTDPVDAKQIWLALNELRQSHQEAKSSASDLMSQLLG